MDICDHNRISSAFGMILFWVIRKLGHTIYEDQVIGRLNISHKLNDQMNVNIFIENVFYKEIRERLV